jgi:hypothetical protein
MFMWFSLGERAISGFNPAAREGDMIRHMVIGLALIGLTACAPPSGSATDGEAAAPTAAAPADAEEAIVAWYRGRHGAALIEPIEIFYGDHSGDGAADALGLGYFEMGGSGAGLTVALFRNEAGQMRFVRIVDDVFGMEPRDVAFAPGRITLTTTMPRPGDPHCCPTGSQDWTIETN